MADINEGLEHAGREELLEELAVSLHAEEIAQSPQSVALEGLPQA